MGVMCQILINKPREGCHKAGQKVTGIVKYLVDEPTEYKDVTLSLKGKGYCHWTERRRKSRDHYTGTEEFLVHYIDIHKKGDDIITLHGEYQYPFEFLLPEDIPSSFKDDIGFIAYKLKLKFVKSSFFSINKVFTTEIPVCGSVYPEAEGPVVIGLDKKIFSLFKKTAVINLKAEIDKSVMIPGENVQIAYKVNNDTDVKITSVKSEIYCYMTYTSDCKRQKCDWYKVKSCEVETTSIAERSTFEYSCILPTLIDLYSIENSKVIRKEYRVKVNVRLPMPHIDAVVELPVVIGEKSGNVETAFEIVEEEPPSYWEAMCEEKDEDEKGEMKEKMKD